MCIRDSVMIVHEAGRGEAGEVLLGKVAEGGAAEGDGKEGENAEEEEATAQEDTGVEEEPDDEVVYEFEIDLWSTAIVFNKGHRIKLHITSSNYPRFDINPNTGEDYYEGCRVEVARNTVYHDKKHPSHILLPIVPLKRR